MFICWASHNTEVPEPLPQFRTNYFVSKPPESVQACGFRPGTRIGNDIPKFGTNWNKIVFGSRGGRMLPVGRRIARFCFTKRADEKGIGIFRGKGTRLARVWQIPRMRNARGKSVVGRHGYRGIFADLARVCGFSFPSCENGMRAPLRRVFFGCSFCRWVV